MHAPNKQTKCCPNQGSGVLALSLSPGTVMSNHARNIHEGLEKPKVSSSSKLLVIAGDYDYYHYGEDGIDDQGWGCAYRSLQTICSYFNIQGFTSYPVPTHLEVQKCLVEVNDKPPSFIKSHQWIGSFEICLALDQLYQVSSKIMHINSGKDILQKGKELADHFSHHGTPVMIGVERGGALTLIGALINEEEGYKIEYLLVVDPHYTGRSTHNSKLQEGGWVAWRKPLSIFSSADMFYNLCLPQNSQHVKL